MFRHSFDVLSFSFGLLFAAAGLLLLGGDAVQASLALPWAGPVAAIGLGLILVIAARPRGDSAGDGDEAGSGPGAGPAASDGDAPATA